MEKENLGHCISELTQIHFYFICNNISRAIWLDRIDNKLLSNKKFVFSKQETLPQFFTKNFERLLFKDTIYESDDMKARYSVGELLRNSWAISLRQAVIMQSQATIEYYLFKNLKSENLKKLIKKAHFIFLKEIRDSLMHLHGKLNKRNGKEIYTFNDLYINTSSGKNIFITDKKLNEILIHVRKDLQNLYTKYGGDTDVITNALIEAMNVKTK